MRCTTCRRISIGLFFSLGVVVFPVRAETVIASGETVSERAVSSAQEGVPVSWHRDLTSAQAASAVSGRPVIVVFVAAWSQPSIALEEVLAESVEASRLLTDCFEPVRVSTSEDPWTTRRMGVSNVPTACIIANDSQEVLAKFECPVDSAEFIVAACNATRRAAAPAKDTRAVAEASVVSDQGAADASGVTDALAADGVPSESAAEVALDGYCPVCVVTRGAWVRGSDSVSATHLGRTYRFAGTEEKRAFLANPEWYAPALGGNDAVLACERGVVVAGRRAFSAAHDSRLYLFASAETRRAFMASPEQYVARVQVARRPTTGTVR